jgi:branched-chain amino acid aminotransferase
LDGRLRGTDDATVSAFDHGLTVGDGVFETVKVVEGMPFAMSRHLERLRESAHGLGLPAPDLDAVREGCAAVVAADPAAARRGRLRITLTAGPGPLGSDRGSAPRPTVMVALAPTGSWPAADRVVLVPWTRNERSAVAGVKTTSYAENVVALAAARAAGAGEALLANTRGQLCEGTGSNVFVVLGGRILTPPLSSGCLAGVTRALVLEWTDAEEADLPVEVLDEADEVFLTSSTRDVQPVSHVGERSLPEVPGQRTLDVMASFAARAAADLDP